MRRFVVCIPLLALVVTGPVNGLTLYKCVLLDGSGVVYQDHMPSEAECTVEEKDVDPDANVIPAAKFTRQGEQQAQPGQPSAGTAVTPDREEDDDMLITGEEGELGAGDSANLPVNKPPKASTGSTARVSGTAGAGAPAGGSSVAAPAPLPPGGFLGP